MLRKLFSWGWSPFLITVLAVVGAIFEWPVEVLGPVLVVILVIGLVMAATAAREKRLERLALRLNELGGHFNRRFMGDSSLSIFVVIRTLLTSDNARVWAWARECEELGAGVILPTSMDGDGTQAGYDIAFTRAISEVVDIPVVASGGAGKLEHFYEAVVQGGAQVLLAASVFHYRILSIRAVKEYLAGKGLQVNLYHV